MAGSQATSAARAAIGWPGMAGGGYQFRLPRDDGELELVHRLVYRTFVRELKQYADPGVERWVDKFHHKNVYLLAFCDERLDGMMALHDAPPFSVAEALPSPAPIASLCPEVLEVRLLAVEPAARRRRLFGGLMAALHSYAVFKRYRYLAISGLLQRQRMYENMGFRSLGPPILKGQAQFVPMLLELSAMPPRSARHLQRLGRDYAPLAAGGS